MKSNISLFAAALVLVLGSGCGTAIPTRDKNPELARNAGYFVSRDAANARGGVGNYVPQYCSQGGWGLPATCSSESHSAPHASAKHAAPASHAAKTTDTLLSASAAPVSQKALLSVYFQTGKASLSSSEQRKVQSWAKSYAAKSDRATLASKPAPKLELKGFADSRGNEAANRSLSTQRAQAVAQELRSAGLNAKVAELAGMGAIKNTNAQAQARTARRVDIVLE